MVISMDQLRNQKNFNFEKLNAHHFLQNGVVSEEFWQLNFYYRKVVEKYLDTLLHLTDIDSQLKDLLGSKVYDKKEKEIYFRISSFDTFFLINNIYLERLSEEEMAFLKNKYHQNVLDEEITQFVKNTLKKVLKNKENYDDKMKIHLEGTLPSDYVPNTSFVIKFTYDGLKDKDSPQFLSTLREMHGKIEKIKDDLENSAKEKLDIPLYVTISFE